MYISMYIYIYIHMYMRICTHVCIHVCVYVYIYIYIYIYRPAQAQGASKNWGRALRRAQLHRVKESGARAEARPIAYASTNTSYVHCLVYELLCVVSFVHVIHSLLPRSAVLVNRRSTKSHIRCPSAKDAASIT